MRRSASQPPLSAPKRWIASIAYSEQVGANRQRVPSSGLIQRFADLGTAPVSQEMATPQAHRAYWQADIAKWRPIIQAAGVYAD